MVIQGTMIHGTMTTSSKKNYLSILGLSPDFDDKELKKAFRREARKWHPDLNKNDLNAEERFKLINEAYEYLSDPNIRKNSSDENKKVNYNKIQKISSKGRKGDLVTNVDLEVEKKIKEYLLEETPNISINAEESGKLTKSSDLTWCIDPLDGTTNYRGYISTLFK